MESVKILVLGSGSSEHSLVRALRRDPSVGEILIAPGNPGIAEEDGVSVVPTLDVADAERVRALAEVEGVDLVVLPGVEPSLRGIADALRAAGVAVLGHSRVAAELAGSRSAVKTLLKNADVESTEGRRVKTESEAGRALDAYGPPYVVKTEGPVLGGDGVLVTLDRDEALEHARAVLDGEHGAALVERYVDGEEVTVACLTDGASVLALAPAQGFSGLEEVPVGSNAPAVGGYSPIPWAPADLPDRIVHDLALPVVREMAARGTPVVGVLDLGIVVTPKGLRVVRLAAGFGDVAATTVLPRLRTPLGGLLHAVATGALATAEPLAWESEAAVSVSLTAPGYPEAPRTGGVVTGIAQAEALENVDVLWGELEEGEDGAVRTRGGRVLTVVGRGPGVVDARARAYAALEAIRLDGGRYRSDVAAGR